MQRGRCLQIVSVKTGVAEQKETDRPTLGSVLHYDRECAGGGKQIPKWLDGRDQETNAGQQPESVQPHFVIV